MYRDSCNKTWRKWVGSPGREQSEFTLRIQTPRFKPRPLFKKIPSLISSSSGHLAGESLKDLATELLFRYPYADYKELHIHMSLATAFCTSRFICRKGMIVFPASQKRGEFSFSDLLTRAYFVLVLIHLFKMLPFEIWIKKCFS